MEFLPDDIKNKLPTSALCAIHVDDKIDQKYSHIEGKFGYSFAA